MHIGEPHKAPSGFREFRREYAMIVLSILTALGFERAAVFVHDRAAAQESRARIEQEINGDVAELRKAADFNDANVTATREALKALMTMIKSANPDAAREQQAIVDELQKHAGLQLPTWQREAWDTAIADQSATHMNADDLRRYAQIYSAARDSSDATHIVLGGAMFDRMADLSVDLKLGDGSAREGAKLIARFLSAATQITAVQKQLLDMATGRRK
jgi:hypothetical protein